MTAVVGAAVTRPGHGMDTPYRAPRKHRRGKYKATVNAKRAKRHLRKLLRAGATRTAIARESGVSAALLLVILSGTQDRIYRQSEALILAVQYRPEMRDIRKVLAVGATRRLQGLVAMGYQIGPLAAGCKVHRNTIMRLLNNEMPMVNPSTAQRIAEGSHRLMRRPGGSEIAARRARRKGWAPLAAWDDIDDPKCRPSRGPTRSSGDRRREVVEDTAELIAQRIPREEIARRMGLTWDSILQNHARCGVSLKGAIE